VLGSINSEREQKMDAFWQNYAGEAVFLAPTSRLARRRQSNFVRHYSPAGLLGKHAWELTDFAAALVEQAGQRVHRMSMLERRLTVQQALCNLPTELDFVPTVTPGLVRHLLHIITELKQAAIEPQEFRRIVESGKNTAFSNYDALVAVVYERYQDVLLSGNLYDVPGVYWEAERCCREDAPTLPGNASVVLLDGFDDFTPSQERFLIALSRHVEHTIIGLHYDPEPNRADLFTLQHKCIERFKAADPERITFQTEPAKDFVRHAANYLFWRDIPPTPAQLVPNLYLMPCADVQHEIESFARTIKQLLIHKKAHPGEIAVCLADMDSHIGAIRTIFKAFGIPLSMRVNPTLLSTATGAFVMRLFKATTSWDRDTVTALLSSPLIAATPGEVSLIMAFPLLARSILNFRDRLRIKTTEDKNVPAPSNKFRLWNRKTEREFRSLSLDYGATIALFEKRLELLDKVAQNLPQQGSLRMFTETLDKEIGILISPDAIASLEGDAAETEAAAIRALHSLLEHLACAAPLDEGMDRSGFVRLLEEAMGDTRLSLPRTLAQGVCCCALEGLRHEQFSHVFIGGLNEGVFPRPSPINAVYPETELQRLQKMNLKLPGSYEHTYRQRMLFYHAINAAQQELTLSWRRQDTKGRDALPSPFIVDIQDMFENHGVEIALAEPGPDCFIPEPLQAASPKDLANVSFYRGWKPLRTSIPEITDAADPVVEIESRRNSTEPFDKYDGCITAQDLLAYLNKKYSPEEHFSVSMLEKYLRFPFAFFMENVLEIKETEKAKTELDPMTRGSILHDALYRFHKHYAGISVKDLLAGDEEEVRNYMAECVRDAFEAAAPELDAVPDVILHIEQRRIMETLQRYLNRMAKDFDDPLVPSHFEVVFGRALRDSTDDLNTTEPFVLDLDGDKVLLTGRIDRIDTDGEGARIIDYKTSSAPSSGHIKAGLDLQLSVYAWAVEQHLLPDTKCSEAWYYSIFGDNKRDALSCKKKADFEEQETNVKARIAEAIHGIRSGYFPPAPDPLHINALRASTAARYEDWRIERKCPERVMLEEEDESA